MNHIRYLNLFEKMTKVRTKNCFFYNGYLIYAVSPKFVSKAIGEKGKNVKKISGILNQKIKIVPFPEDKENVESVERFFSGIFDPVKFKNIEIDENEIRIEAGKQNKASLIGRDRQREKELKEIVKSFFGKEVKIL